MQLTTISSTNPKLLSKTFTLSDDGGLQKQSAGQLVEGQFKVINCRTVTEFSGFLTNLNKNEAFCYGRPSKESGYLLSKKLKQSRKDTEAITRTRDDFDWPEGTAIFFGDYDPPSGAKGLTPEQIRSILCNVMPELTKAPMVLWHSASSHIYHKETGETLKGNGGIRIYLAVADGRDISRFGQILYKRLWLNGYGHYVCSKSGALLSRSLLDDSVWQPERLDFAAGANIDEQQLIEQRRPAPQLINTNANPLNTGEIANLSAEEESELEKIQAAEKEKIKPVQDETRESWVEVQLLEIEDESEREQKRETLINAVENRKLFADFQLHTGKNALITVGEILDNPDKWHNQYLKDPLEPDYNGGSNVSWLNLRSGGKPYLYSHAHGGASYTLLRQTTTINIAGGELPRILNETASIISLSGETYQRGGMLVRMAESEVLPVTAPWLKNHIEENINFLKWDGRSKEYKAADAPAELAIRYQHNRGSWLESELTGIINAPVFRLDGTLLDSPGYDKKTGLLLKCHHVDQFPRIPVAPNPTQALEALKTLWEPFRFFPFVSPDDTAGVLAAMLTAIQRPVLTTAPAFGFNAHVAGSGKSYLAKAISWLSGNEPREMPWSTEAEEQRKRLTAALINGHSSVLIDNVNGLLDSDTLCSILTGESYEDRRLGFSENVKLSTRTLFLVTGNNVTVIKDLWRRVVVATIDHGAEKPSKLAFPFNPVARVRENWLKYRIAGLTILGAYIAASSPRMTQDSVGSFEVWNDTIRQCVLWLAQLDSSQSVVDLGDPINLLEQSYSNDPELERLEQLQFEWYSAYKSKEKTIAEVIKDSETAFSKNSQGIISAELLSDISGGNKPNSRAIAAFMRRNKGRIVNGCVIQSGRAYGTRASWYIQKQAA